MRAFQFHQGVRMGVLMLVAIILTKMGFSPGDIGRYESFLFTANALTFFWCMGMKNALLSYSPQYDDAEKKRLLSSVSLLFVVIILVEVLIVYLYTIYRPGYDLAHVGVYMGLFLLFQVPAQLIEMILIIRKKAHTLFWETIVFNSFLIVVLVFLCSQYSDLRAPIWALLVWSALRFLYFIYLLKDTGLDIDFGMIKAFAVFSFPLILHVLLGNGMEYVDGFMVKYFFDDASFAFFRYGARELPVNTVLITAMAMAMIPYATENLEKGLAEIRKRISKVMDWLFPLSALLILVSKPLYASLFSEAFEPSARIFSIYLMIITSRVILAQVAMYARHLNKQLMIIALIEIVINIVLSLIFVQFWGLEGIAYATLVAYIAEKLILVGYTKVYLGIDFSEYMDIRKYSIYVGGLILVYVVSMYLW